MIKLAVHIFAIYFAVCQTAAQEPYCEVPLMNVVKNVHYMPGNQEINVYFLSIYEVRKILIESAQDSLINTVCSRTIECRSGTCEISQNPEEIQTFNIHTQNCYNLQNIDIHIDFKKEGPGTLFFNKLTGNLNVTLNASYQYIYYNMMAVAMNQCKIEVEECNGNSGVNNHTSFSCKGKKCDDDSSGFICWDIINSNECCDSSITVNEDCSTTTSSNAEVTTFGHTYSPSVVTEIGTGTDTETYEASQTTTDTYTDNEAENGFTVFTPTLIMLMVFTGTAVLVFVIGCICAVMAIVTKPSNRIEPTG